MCDGCAPKSVDRGGLSRRHVLGAGMAAAVVVALPSRATGASRQGFEVLPRSAWAGDLPAGPIAPEPDVRTLVVHHTVDSNTHGPDDVIALLRRIHAFHTGPDKRWPDVAYNFFVDRFGRVWEGRAGSLAGPVAGDATGGNQGFDQKCAFVGDHRVEAPTPEAAEAMANLVAMLADRHALDTRSGSTTTFESRGSNLHPAGTTVTIPTITGHRSVSRTACPGDAGMALVTDVLPGVVSARRTTTATTTTTAAPVPSTTTTTTAAPTTTPATTTTTSTPTTNSPTSSVPAATAVDVGGPDDDSVAVPAGVAAVALLGAGVAALRARRDAR